MKWLHHILEIFREELHNSLFDEGVIVFFFIVPLLYPLLYAYLYGNESVREVATVAVDLANSSTSRDFLRKVDATADVEIVGHCADMQEAVNLIHKRQAYCLIYIPADFDRALMEGRQAIVELYSDMGSLLYYKAVLSSCTEVSLAMNKDIKAQRLVGATEKQVSTFAYPIEYEYVPMFNTQNGFASFLIPAVLVLLIQQTMVLGIGMMAGEEREKKRRGILEPHVIGKRPIEMLLGKGAAYLAIYVVVSAYVFCVVPRLFHLVQIGHWTDLVAFLFPYLLACVFFSMTISGIASWRVKETDRIAAMAAELRKVGAEVRESMDSITVTPPKDLQSASIETYNDHRMAMCFSLVSLGGVSIKILDPACVNKTYPNFFEDFKRFAK
jgi:ABC-2 type transport system permease protein